MKMFFWVKRGNFETFKIPAHVLTSSYSLSMAVTSLGPRWDSELSSRRKVSKAWDLKRSGWAWMMEQILSGTPATPLTAEVKSNVNLWKTLRSRNSLKCVTHRHLWSGWEWVSRGWSKGSLETTDFWVPTSWCPDWNLKGKSKREKSFNWTNEECHNFFHWSWITNNE